MRIKVEYHDTKEKLACIGNKLFTSEQIKLLGQ